MHSLNNLQTISFDGNSIQPSKVVCVGRNYAEHIAELNNQTPSEPVIFVKPNSAISKDLRLTCDEELHYEGELAFIIESGKIAGVGFGLDLTKREMQTKLKDKGLPWERAKAFDGSAVFSDFVSINEVNDSMQLALYIDDKLIQRGGYEQMIYKPEVLIADIQKFMTLCDGDILLTGTPKGVGKITMNQRFLGQVLINDSVIVEQCWQAKANVG